MYAYEPAHATTIDAMGRQAQLHVLAKDVNDLIEIERVTNRLFIVRLRFKLIHRCRWPSRSA